MSQDVTATPREFDSRPWGCYEVLDEGATFKVKRIEVLSGKRLSYQKHAQRAEHWVVVEGTAKVTLDGREISLSTGESVDIPIGSAHRVENSGPGNLVFIEVQRGNYLGEDDITRLQDDFGRAE
jgi:mannose-6-phosphate isomerase